MDFFTIWVVVWIVVNAVFAIPVAYVAQQKGRSAVGFFFLSFFLSFIVGILVVLALPKLDGTESLGSQTGQIRKTSQGDMVKCPYCAEWIKAEAKVCKHCGRDVADEIAAIKLSAEAAQAATDEQAAANAKAIEDQRALEAEKRRQFFKSPAGRVSIGAAVVIILAAAGFFIFGSVQSQNAYKNVSNWDSAASACGVAGGQVFKMKNGGVAIHVANPTQADCVSGKLFGTSFPSAPSTGTLDLGGGKTLRWDQGNAIGMSVYTVAWDGK